MSRLWQLGMSHRCPAVVIHAIMPRPLTCAHLALILRSQCRVHILGISPLPLQLCNALRRGLGDLRRLLLQGPKAPFHRPQRAHSALKLLCDARQGLFLRTALQMGSHTV